MPDEVVQTPFGAFLVNPQDCVGTTLKAGTLWDGPGFLEVIAKEYAAFGERGVTILDVGANIGSFSVYCAHKGAWRVVAVEPVPETMVWLKANLDLNKATCADVVIPLEVAAYHRQTTLYAPPFDRDNTGATALRDGMKVGETRIAAEPLDSYRYLFGARVSLIKVDAQGCDGAALMGLQETIARDHPAIVFEWEEDLARNHPWRFSEVSGWLGAQGYDVQPWPSQPNNFLAVWRRD